jgi:hypothetical protein
MKSIPDYELDAVRTYVEARCEERRCANRRDVLGQIAAKRRQSKSYAGSRAHGAVDVASRVLDERPDVINPSEVIPAIIERLA